MEIGGVEMSNLVCPVCGSSNIQTERRPDGFHHCMDCRYSWEIGAKQLKQTVFDRISASPEVLAEKLVYIEGLKMTSKSKYYDGWTTHEIIPQDIWKSTITHESYKTKSEAIAATVAKLKEVSDAV